MAIKRKRLNNPNLTRSKVPIEHTAFHAYLVRYNEALRVRDYSPRTLHRRESDIRRFVGWCDERGLGHPRDITKPILERYQKYLYYYRQSNGEPLSSGTRIHYLTSVKQFFKWLTQENHLLYNPASELVVPKPRPRLPMVLSQDDIEALLAQPNLGTPYGLRDRAILEVLYGTGLRRSELCGLALHDLMLKQRTLRVRHGKGNKDRLVPLGQSAAYWLARYLEWARPQLLLDLHNETLFLNDYGETFRDTKLGDKVKRYMKNAGITTPGSCHLLRHAMATHMLENGAELRFIQAMLGHANLSATQIYTHVSLRKLREIHEVTHPRGKRESWTGLDAEVQEGIEADDDGQLETVGQEAASDN